MCLSFCDGENERKGEKFGDAGRGVGWVAGVCGYVGSCLADEGNESAKIPQGMVSGDF
jgi:hypothetical protein